VSLGGITDSCDGKGRHGGENGYVAVSPGIVLNVNGGLESHIQLYLLPKIDMQIGRKLKMKIYNLLFVRAAFNICL
jgi:hypothetical protein